MWLGLTAVKLWVVDHPDVLKGKIVEALIALAPPNSAGKCTVILDSSRTPNPTLSASLACPRCSVHLDMIGVIS